MTLYFIINLILCLLSSVCGSLVQCEITMNVH